jgi:multiple sugar transport system permease protein
VAEVRGKAVERGLHLRERLSGPEASAERLGALLIAPTVILLVLIVGYPAFYNIYASFQYFVLTDPGTEHFIGLQNYTRVFSGTDSLSAWGRTILYTVISVAIQFVVGLVFALAMHQNYRGRGVVRAAVLVPWAVPTVVSALLWKTNFDPRIGFVNYLLGVAHLPGAGTTWLNGVWTSWTVILVADAWKNTPFLALILLSGLQVIPDDLYEQAQIDGAGILRRFWYVTLPLLKPSIQVALIFRTLSAFLVFDVIYAITGGGPGNATNTVAFINWRAFLVDTDFGYGGAVSVVLTISALLIAVAYLRILRPST